MNKKIMMLEPNMALLGQVKELLKQNENGLKGKLEILELVKRKSLSFEQKMRSQDFSTDFLDYWRAVRVIEPFSLNDFEQLTGCPTSITEDWSSETKTISNYFMLSISSYSFYLGAAIECVELIVNYDMKEKSKVQDVLKFPAFN